MWSSVFLGAQAPFLTPIETITSLQFWNPKFWSLLYKHFAVKCYLTWHEAFFSLYPSSVDRFVGQCINIYTSCPQPHWVHDFSKNKGKKGRGRKEGGRERRKKGGKGERREGKKKEERGNSKARARKLPDIDWDTVLPCWWYCMGIDSY